MSDDLKTCPFCGGMAEGNKPPMRQVVQCNDCGATVVGKKAWNTRAAIEALQAERDAAVDALYAVELEYDPSENGQNALKMYEIASDAMDAIRARSNKEPGQ